MAEEATPLYEELSKAISAAEERESAGFVGAITVHIDTLRALRDQLRAYGSLVDACRLVVAADTFVTPGKSRAEATMEAIGKLETALPPPPAGQAVSRG